MHIKENDILDYDPYKKGEFTAIIKKDSYKLSVLLNYCANEFKDFDKLIKLCIFLKDLDLKEILSEKKYIKINKTNYIPI